MAPRALLDTRALTVQTLADETVRPPSRVASHNARSGLRAHGRVKEASCDLLVALGFSIAVARCDGRDRASRRSQVGTQPRGDLRQLPRHRTASASATWRPSPASRRTKSCARCRSSSRARRPATIMNQLAKGYTDEQIEALAGWFAAQKARSEGRRLGCNDATSCRRSARGSGAAALDAARLRVDGGSAAAARSSSSAAAMAARPRPSTSGCGATAQSK